MADKLRVGFASLEHDHVWGEIKHWLALENVELVAVGDPSERLLNRMKEAGVPRAYSSWQEMIATEDLDIVQACSDNRSCADITELAMSRGAHVISEKPMAATLAQAERMMAASEKFDRKLMINWPNVWADDFQEWERQILAGRIGRVIHIRRRNAHNGPKEIGCDPAFVDWLYDAERNGAGALMDYCCYGANIAVRFLGLPQRVTGIRGVLAKDYPLPDDNAIILMQYADAFAHTEASWTEVAWSDALATVAYGTEGVCWMADGKVKLHRKDEGIEVIEPKPRENPHENGPQYFVHCILNDLEPEGFSSARVSRDAQEILEAGLRSSNEGVHQNLPITP